MKALILEGIKTIRLTDIKTPDCGDNETLLKVSYCSVCRTDAKMWFQGQRDLVLPRVLGHEICGQKLDSNEQFIVWPASVCNKCRHCKNGAENLCGDIQIMGFHRDGGFAQYIKVPEKSLIKVPESVPPEIACMTELLSSAINAIERTDLQKDQKVLIFGGGPAGLMLGLACKHFGADPFVVENNPEKLELVTQFCKIADMDISGSAVSDKFDVAINAAPAPGTLIEGISRLNTGGKYCLFSGFTKNVNIRTDLLNEVHYRQLTLIGAYGSTKRQMETALGILENNVHTVKLLVHEIIPLERVPSVLPEILSGQAVKYVVDLQLCE
jgi:threonine dehydrogenase-like Zn-dependent dehydrogenase